MRTFRQREQILLQIGRLARRRDGFRHDVVAEREVKEVCVAS